MKYILLIITIIILCGCGNHCDLSTQPKFKNGDIVYILPDSTIGMAFLWDRAYDDSTTYRVRYKLKTGQYYTSVFYEYELIKKQ